MELGITFSHRHLKNIGLNPKKSLLEAKTLGIKWIRLCSYWDEIEQKEGVYDFQNMDRLLDLCDKNNITVVLTVGMKAPRYPEYYLPKWSTDRLRLGRLKSINSRDKLLMTKTLKFLKESVQHFKNRNSIKVWQVENEPMDNSGDKWMKIDKDFLRQEVKLVKKLDPSRKVMINLWGNELGVRKIYKKAIELADIIGLDIYLRHPVPFFKFFHRYIGPLDSKEKLRRISEEIKKSGREIFITELQAEPWEPGEILTKKDNPPSFLPEHLQGNLEYVSELRPEVVLLWGFEYWLWREQNGDRRYWKGVVKAIKKFNI